MNIKITKCTGEGCPLKEKCYRYLTRKENEEVFKTPPYKKLETPPNSTYSNGYVHKPNCDSFLLNEN